MGRVLDEIDDRLIEWMGAQHLFFVATAPSGSEGHVNLSPKGHDTFRILDRETVAYQDLTGSGVETIAHLRENSRLTIMFCAFEGPPTIVRLYGSGQVHELGTPGFDELAPHFDPLPGARAIIVLRVQRISSSCGYSVPFMAYEGERDKLIDFAERRGADRLVEYRREKNRVSIDGLPGFPAELVDDAPRMG